jgi:hypothetical protein
MEEGKRFFISVISIWHSLSDQRLSTNRFTTLSRTTNEVWTLSAPQKQSKERSNRKINPFMGELITLDLLTEGFRGLPGILNLTRGVCRWYFMINLRVPSLQADLGESRAFRCDLKTMVIVDKVDPIHNTNVGVNGNSHHSAQKISSHPHGHDKDG